MNHASSPSSSSSSSSPSATADPESGTGSSHITSLLDILRSLSSLDDVIDVQYQLGAGIQKFVPFDGIVSASVRGLAAGQYKVTRCFTDVSNLRSRPSNPWGDWQTMPVHAGGFIGQALAQERPQQYCDLFLRDDPVLGNVIADFGSCLAVPLFDGGRALNWNFLLRSSPSGFTEKESELMLLLGNLMGLATRNLVTSQHCERLNQRITAQLEQVAHLQHALLPRTLPSIPGLHINAHYRPCEQAGGDYYDFIPIPTNGHAAADRLHPWAIMIADVSGHGASAAVIMAMVQTLAHAHPIDPDNPGRLLEQMNTHLIAERLDSSFVTAFLGVFHPEARTFAYASAGHHPPRIKHIGENNPAQPFALASAPPLGILDTDFQIETRRRALNSRDTIILFTDGIVEAMSPTRELFGVDRLDHAISCCSGEPDCIIGSLTSAVRQHEQGNRPADDQTIVALKVI